MKLFKREITTTQSKYKVLLERKNINQQCSYNLPLELEDYLKSNGALKRISPEGSEINVLYKVSDEYKVRLGANILAVIGESYGYKNAGAIFTHTEGEKGSSKKIQLKRNDFKFQGKDYEWFVKLYDNNIEGMNFVTGVDVNNKIIFFDLELSSSIFMKNYESNKSDQNEKLTGGENTIYYGTPGCGKSFYVNKTFNIEGTKVFRTVFHPEYSNADFVGQILPDLDPCDESKVIYKFKDGIFTTALKFALTYPSVKVILVIEEINRGNASSIFGEIFQLLDRDDNGDSIFGIKNSYIAKSLGLDEDSDIKIPSNLSLIGTMNTSDQNVYSLDTAFKRRWELRKIRNTFADVDGYESFGEQRKKDFAYKYNLSKMYVPGSAFTWRQFIEKINAKISEKNKGYSIQSEDKEVGVYFVSQEYLSQSKNDIDSFKIQKFGEKVLMYLWNDVVKTNPEKLFKAKAIDGSPINSLDNLLDEFERIPNGDTLNVFADDIFNTKQDGQSLIEEARVGDPING
ncbi:MAG TPA: hypothetical protein DCR94_06335 [Firmicutes bacterium]|nr:hypothetical protein [Bacillota bacterium]